MARERKAKQAQDKADKEAIVKQKEELKKRALDLKEQSKGASKVLPPIFQIETSNFTEVQVCNTNITMHGCGVDAPWILQDAAPLNTWLNDKIVSQVMGNFGGKYKKQKAYEVDKKYSQVFVAKQGKDETEALFKDIINHLQAYLVC